MQLVSETVKIGDMSDQHPQWTPATAAEDLVAQIEELRQEGAPSGDIAAALEREGLSPDLADDLVEQVTGLRPTARPDVTAQVQWGIDVLPIRRVLRESPGAVQVAPARVAELAQALVDHGVQPATAEAVAEGLASTDRSLHASQRKRLRSLGIQAMVAGAVFGAFFATAAMTARPGAWVALATAAGAGAMGGYGWVLYRNNRDL